MFYLFIIIGTTVNVLLHFTLMDIFEMTPIKDAMTTWNKENSS